MTDVTQGQDAAQDNAPKADVDDLFAKQDVDDLFPANQKPSSATGVFAANNSPIHDMIFSDPGRSHARVLDAFGYGFKQDWGAGQQEFSEADEALRKAGVWNDYSKGQRNIIKAANEAIMRPAVAGILAAKSTFSGLFAGTQAAVAQQGAELGAPNLGREIAAIPEAFPAGFDHPLGVPHLPEPIAEAKSFDVIGAGEQGYFGTAPVTPETIAAQAEAAKVQDVAKPEGLSGHDPEAGPSPLAQPAAVEPPAEAAAPDVHAVARQIAPDTFTEFDALAQKKDTFRRWIDELRETRDQDVRENAPHADEIADLQTKLADATPRLAKKYNERLTPLIAERDDYIADQTKGDSADMAKIRQQLMQADYRQRDLAPDVAKAYRDAEARMPRAGATEAAPITEEVQTNERQTNEQALAETPTEITGSTTPREPSAAVESAKVKTEREAETSTPIGQEPVPPPIAHAPSIVADVSQKLKAAGRPAEEADAAAQVVAAYWETRAQRFEGAKGTAAEMYAREAPEIVAGKEKPSKKARELELAQKGRSLEQAAPIDWTAGGGSKTVDIGKTTIDYGVARDGKSAEIILLKTPEESRGEGYGRAAMEEFISQADDQGLTLFLNSDPMGKGISKRKLDDFYKSLGFVKNTGRNKDFTSRAEFVRQPELKQGVQGRIRLRDDARSTITLMKNADASTFIHETGHEWLERMLDDARDEQAPAGLKSDAQTVLKWLGVDSPDGVKTRHHEKFARGFETYMMEGRAPSTALARVFAKFKDWLTTIYKTVSALKAPISDDIRGVFDRLLAEKPEKTVIAPERETKGGLTEKHSALAESTPPEKAYETAGEIRKERDSLSLPNQLQENDARLSNAREGTEEHAPGGAESSGHADASGTDRGAAEAPGGSGGLGEGGSEAAPESTQARAKSERLNTAPTPLLRFIASKGGIRASDELIKDLRQSLGASNRLIPGFGQLIRQPKQLSSAARKAGRSEAMTIDRAREAAIEAGHLPEGASITDFLDAIDNEVRGIGHANERPTDPAELEHARHNFLEGLNDKVKEAGGAELSEAERARALELWQHEGLNDPNEIIERLALEADDGQIEGGAPERAPGIPGWDVAAPGWELSDDGRPTSGAGEGAAPASAIEPGRAAARAGGKAENGHPLDANADLPKSETQLIDKAGNIRLDNLGTPEDVSAVIRATAEEMAPYDAAITRGRVSDAEVMKLADALGMDAEKISDRKLGQAFNAEQIVAARKLLIQSAGNVRDMAAKLAGGTEADVLAYAQARARHLMIQEQVSGITAEAGRALRAFRSMAGSKEAADISAFLKNTQGKTLYQMKEEGALLAMMGTPQQVSKAVHEASLTRWQKTRSGILSWFINNLISGPITHAGYSVGNTVVQLFKATVDTSAAAAYGAIRDLPAGERVYFGEVGAQLYGMVRGMRDGYSPAWTAMKTGVPFMKGDVEGMIGQIEAAHRPQAIPGALGYVMETPSRAVTAIHTMHYSMNYEAEIARRAFRSAVADGIDPTSDAFNRKIADFTQSPPQAEMEAAHDEALKMVLMKRTQFGTAQYHLQKAVNSNILAKIVMPFMQVGANILHESFIERTPLGAMSQTVRDNLMGKNGEIARQTQASRIAVGIGISTAVVGLTAEGILTGGGPSDPKQLAIKEMTGWKPYSIKVGEFYVPYRKYLGGMGPLIAGTADMYEVGHTLNEEGLTKAAASSLFGFAEVIADESWAKGLSNFIDAARHWDRDGGRYLRNLAADFIPFSIGLSQVTNLTDPYRREVRSMLDVARAHIPGLSRGLFPVRDIWGEPIESHTALGPSRANHDPATQALLDADYYPARMGRKIRGVELTDQQYDDLTRLAGRMSRMRVNALVNTPGFALLPKQLRAQKLQDVISNPENGARESARAMVLMQSMHSDNNIVTKATDAKKAKVTKLTSDTVH